MNLKTEKFVQFMRFTRFFGEFWKGHEKAPQEQVAIT